MKPLKEMTDLELSKYEAELTDSETLSLIEMDEIATDIYWEKQRRYLRDKFAMAALTGLLAGCGSEHRSGTCKATLAYGYADAMLITREKKDCR